jgi:hypothetical protein
VRNRRLPAPLIAAALLAAGCGSTHTYANRDRPASPVTISGAIDSSRVRISPGTVGAGPLVVLMANLTDRPQRLRLETDGQGPGIRSQAVIPPQGTGQLQVDAPKGSYVLAVRDGAVKAASLKVGAKRPSAQNTLLEP